MKCEKNLKKGEAFQDLPRLVLPGMRQVLMQSQGMARSIFIRLDQTQECESLVTVDAIAVAVVISLAEISLVDAAVAETGVVVLVALW